MHDDALERLISTRTSRFYYFSASDDEPALAALLAREEGRGFHSRMFTEDASRILPYGRGASEGFTVAVGSDQTKDLIRQALPTRYGSALSIEDGVRNFVEEAAVELIFGRAVYEIDYLYEAPSSSEPIAFRIERIDSRTLGRRRGELIQYVPKGLGGKAKKRGLHYVVLPRENLVEIRLDPATKKEVRLAMAVFQRLDAAQGTPVRMLQGGAATNSSFNFSNYRSETDLVALKSTRAIGWAGRDLFAGDDMLEPYRLWRGLQFLQFKIKLRETILAGLQKIVDHAGKRIGFSAMLEYSGLVSAGEVDKAQQDLDTGQRSVAGLYELLGRG